MGKIKKSSKGLVLKIITLFFAALAFISMAFTFYTTVVGAGSVKKTSSFFISDWIEQINSANENADGLTAWKTSKVFLIITLILIAIIAIICIIKFFKKIGVLNLVLKIVGILGIISAVIFLITFIVGCAQMSSSEEILGVEYFAMALPNVGVCLLGISSIAASSLAIAVSKK